MTVLSRKVGEKVRLDKPVRVTVAEVDSVRLAFDAVNPSPLVWTEPGWQQYEPANRCRSPEFAFVCEW